MKKILFIALCILCGCSPTRVQSTEPQEGRFTYERQEIGANCIFVIKDTKTGSEYLAIHAGYGVSIIELNQNKAR